MKDNIKMYQRICFLICLDSLFVVLASFLAIFIRLEFVMDWEMWQNYFQWVWLDIIISIASFTLLNLYRSLWRFASMVELRKMIVSVLLATFVKLFVFVLVLGVVLPRSWYIMEPMILLMLCGSSRFLYRNIRSLKNKKHLMWKDKDYTNVMIVGAGEAGNILLRETYLSEHVHKQVVCFIDDDIRKQGRFMNGVPIVGGKSSILENVKKYNVSEIYIAIPSATVQQRKEIIEICKDTGCKLKILPGIYQLINNEVSISKLKNVEIEDLLGREPIQVNIKQIASYVQNKIVMVTGGGGSIGSELCRQIAANQPKQLIIVDIYENNAYDIQMELKEKYPQLDLQVRIASIRDEKKMDCLFNEFRPELFYHAAAHKHVPLMEDSPNEAVKNNVFGTLNLVKAADKYHVKRFVQISTDKAVNPTNIMGATKRMCEMIIQTYDKHSQTDFTAVRFGNVLGSNGSVIPLFKKQIAHGGPVTVTDKNIIRYFMTIPEAVSLVIQAGIYAHGGEIFVLDMGKPMKIDDLARNLIKLSGYTPDVDIPIVYTGLRPGEKLYEELLMGEEGLQKTENSSMFIGHPIQLDEEKFFKQLTELHHMVENEEDHVKEKVREIIPTYQPYGQSKD
ncbi:MAG: polysaccharide biosynthesis protein [Massilimicrobiota timonensis]